MWPHELKLRRASQHFEQLKTQINRWEEAGHGYALHIDTDGHEPRYIARAEILRPVEDEPFPLFIGDFLQNARAGLDYIAGALGDMGAGDVMPESAALSTMFPIVGPGGANRFAEIVERRLPTVTHPVRAVIEDLQPYKVSPDLWQFEPLWILHELARLDRHRFMQVGLARGGGFRLNPERSRNVRIESLHVEEGSFRVLEGSAAMDAWPGADNRAVLATFTAFPIDPKREMHMDWEGAVELTFDGDRLPDSLRLIEGMPILSTLYPVLIDIQNVFRALAPFLPAEPPQW